MTLPQQIHADYEKERKALIAAIEFCEDQIRSGCRKENRQHYEQVIAQSKDRIDQITVFLGSVYK